MSTNDTFRTGLWEGFCSSSIWDGLELKRKKCREERSDNRLEWDSGVGDRMSYPRTRQAVLAATRMLGHLQQPEDPICPQHKASTSWPVLQASHNRLQLPFHFSPLCLCFSNILVVPSTYILWIQCVFSHLCALEVTVLPAFHLYHQYHVLHDDSISKC